MTISKMQKSLRIARIILAIFFFACAILYFVVGPRCHPIVLGAAKMNIMPMILSQTLGVTFVWFVITFVWGRIYCSFVCPLGTLQDIIIRMRSRIPGCHRPFSYKSASRLRLHILLIYVVCLLIGFTAVPLALEPWNMFGNISTALGAHGITNTWVQLGFGALAGMIIGLVSLCMVAGYAIIGGRDFCNEICPLGTAMSYMAKYSAFTISIDPDLCDGCLLCEDHCKASCIKVISRHVDNSRCVRCFDCTSICPHQAISYSLDRKRPATPLFQRHKTAMKP